MFLVIVARHRPDLYAYIRRVFFKDTRYTLLFDRRRVQRRRLAEAHAFERRARDRRVTPDADAEVHVQGWAAVPIGGRPADRASAAAGVQT
jgi:hypothetical protein